jgi:hypothetical protein
LEESIKELAAEVDQPWESRNEAERVKESKVRIGSAQPKSPVIDYRLTVPEVLAQVDKSLEALTQIIHKAGDAGCDMLALPDDYLATRKGDR